MTALEPTPERIAVARRAQGRDWTFGPEGAGEIMRDEALGDMVVAGLVSPHFITATQQINGGSDHYRLTDRGEQWLAEHEEQA